MRVKVPLRELSDLDVRFVSLVDRGANRIPFRIIKSEQENEMLNLTNLSRAVVKKSGAEPVAEKPKAQVTAVILSKSDEALMEKAKEVLKAEGFDFTEHKVFEDGTSVLFKSEDYQDEAQIISLSGNMAVVVKGFSPYAEGLTFTEMATSRGFFDNLNSAMSALSDATRSTLYSAATPSEARTKVSKAVSEFNAYIGALIDGLPSTVFKADTAISDLVANFVVPEAVKEAAATAEATAAVEGEGEVKKQEGEPAAEAAASESQEPVQKDEPAQEIKADEQKPVEKQDETAVLLLKSLQDLTAQVAEIGKTVSGLGAEVQEIKKSTEEKLAEAVQKADTATRVVKNSVVVSSDTGGDPQAVVKKSEKTDPRSGLFDTAFLGRR